MLNNSPLKWQRSLALRRHVVLIIGGDDATESSTQNRDILAEYGLLRAFLTAAFAPDY
jgi:hypothetical protein